MTAVDNDTLLQPATVYTILNDSSQLPFYLNETMGELINIQSLDSETFSKYILIIQARDAEYNRLLPPDTLTLLIWIEDENDNDPFFLESSYNASVPENTAIGTTVITVTAVDNDVDEDNRLITYEILNSTDFIINPSGNVITNTMLDRERQDFYELILIARHPNDVNSSGMAILNIYISDVSDNDPVLILYPNSSTLVEPAMMITLSNMLTIMDDDLNPTLNYATVQILPNGNTPALGQLLSPHNITSIVLMGNNSQILQFTGEATLQQYQKLLRYVVYQDDADEPIPEPRLIEFTVGSQNSTSTSLFNLSVTVINDNPPYLTLDSTNSTDPGDLIIGNTLNIEGAYFSTFIEEGDPVPITSTSLDITDADSGFNDLNYAIVYIKDSRDVEKLVVNLTGNIQRTADSNYTWLNLTGPATIEEFEETLRRIRLCKS